MQITLLAIGVCCDWESTGFAVMKSKQKQALLETQDLTPPWSYYLH